MKLEAAKRVAEEQVKLISMFAECVEVAGSIRRALIEVDSIDIVAIPRFSFRERGGLTARVNLLREHWDTGGFVHLVTGEDEERIEVRIHSAESRNWGVVMALATGSAEFRTGLAARAQAIGRPIIQKRMVSHHGKGRDICVPDERSFFSLLGMSYVEPEKREDAITVIEHSYYVEEVA